MEMDQYEHGVPSWVDIGVPDTDKAAAFYSALFGWEVSEGTEETGGYRLAYLRNRPVAGIGPQQQPDMPPYWTTYVSVDDADAIAALVEANGGAVIVPAMDVLSSGRMAVFADPVGAVFSVWQPREHIGAGIVNEHGTLSWNELMTTDVEASKAFYAAVFGWGERSSEGDMPYTEWQVSDRSVGGMMAKPPMVPAEVPPNWGVYFAVDGLDASMAKVTELGGTVLMGPMPTPAGPFATCLDDQGGAFYLIELT